MTHFNFDEIIYIVDGKVQRNNSKIYDEICKSMVDTDDMQQFASYVGLYGFYEFFRECFDEPDAESNADTTKFSHMKERIRDLKIHKVLDYGAGKGRFSKLLTGIPKIEYNAFECFHKYHKELESLNLSGKIYTNASDIPKGEFDAVLLINTLHEIPLDMWRTTFETIRRILKDDGRLFFCETSPLVMGEKVINAGFLVLSTMEQHDLFNVESVHLDESHKLHYSEIPKEKIPVLDEEKLKTTLDLLKTNSFKSWESEDKNARSAAFYAVQHLNAKKAMKQLPEIIKIAEELANIQKNIDLEPDNATHWNALGVKLHKRERYDEALIAKQKAVELEPANARYQNNLGITLHKMERYDEALIANERASGRERAYTGE
jgi:SAM-dependent methyltransferase